MKPRRVNRRQRKALQQRLDELGVVLDSFGGQSLMDALIRDQAVIITVDRPDGPPEWSFGWDSSRWDPIKQWALAYFQET